MIIDQKSKIVHRQLGSSPWLRALVTSWEENEMNKSYLAACVTAASVSFGSTAAQADMLDVHMSIPKDLTFLADSAKIMDETLRSMSGGDVGLNLFGSGELVPAGEILESVSTGAIPDGWSFLGQWGGQIPVAPKGVAPICAT
ncbi:MAG: hypothetical protein AAFY25_07790, partial [Pseudomonadota bacterium]